MGTLGNKVIVTSQEDFERLVILPAAVKGEYDPEKNYGVVYFASVQAAVYAWRAYL